MPLNLAASRQTRRICAHDEPQDYLWTLNFGPQHPATHTTLRLVLKLDGERVIDAMPDIGYLHSGFEKIGEHLNYNQYVTVTDRMNYISPMANNVAWHGAVEKLLGLELTPRCKYIRVIIAELSRISDHLLCNGAAGLDTGAFTYFLVRVLSAGSDLRHFRDALRGAVHQQLHARRRLDVRHDAAGDREDSHVLQELSEDARRHGAAAEPQQDLRRSHERRGRADQGGGHQSQLHWAIARASGVTRDLRKDEPYLSYADFDFQVCCRRPAIAFARYLVRMEEMRESLRIVEQAIENLPSGPVECWHRSAHGVSDKQQVYSTIEGTISHFELQMSNRGFEVPNEETTPPSKPPMASWAFTLPAMAAKRPIGPAAGRRRLSTSRFSRI